MAANDKTTLDTDNTKPAVTAPGDGPHDTTDPKERASSVLPAPSAETVASGVGTVNSQLPLPPIPDPEKVSKPRTEEYDATLPNGDVVRVERNIETGRSRIKSGTDTGSVPTQSGR